MVVCRLLRSRVFPEHSKVLSRLHRGAPKQSEYRLTVDHSRFKDFLKEPYYLPTERIGSLRFTGVDSSPAANFRVVAHTGSWPGIVGVGHAGAFLNFSSTRSSQHLLTKNSTQLVGGPCLPHGGCRSMHSIASSMHGHDIAGKSAASPPSAASVAASSGGSLPASTAMSSLGTAGPTEGSYAKELLEHIQDVAELSANESAGAMTSSGWFVDWLLALKLGLGVPWCVAIPAAGCLLRLVTLPIAIDSERDRRQRQLVEPQFSRLKDKMKVAYESGNTAEYQRLRVETKAFLKKHGIGVLPTSLMQMLLLGLAISLSTPEIRKMAQDPLGWKGFAVEQPGWLESLALPDATGLTAVLCWFVLVSTMAAGWMVSSRIRRQSPSTPAPTGIASPLVMRSVSIGAATLFAFYSGTQLPAACRRGVVYWRGVIKCSVNGAALLFLVPAFGLQSVFMRIFRFRSVERGLHFVPEGLRPLQQTYVSLLERREPALVAAWKRRAFDAQSCDAVSEATAGGAAATSRAMVILWREVSQSGKGFPPQHLKTWAEHVAEKQQARLSNAAVSGKPSPSGTVRRPCTRPDLEIRQLLTTRR